MFRKEFLAIGLLATGIFLLVAGLSFWLTRALAQEAGMLVADTLPGLVNTGEALSVMDNNWEKTLGLTALPTAEMRSNVIHQIQSRSTEEYWHRYQESIFDAHDQQLFSALQIARAHSRELTTNFWDLVNAQQLAAADQLLKDRLVPAFNAYREAGLKLFELNKEIGNQRSGRILTVARWLPVLAGVTGVLIFGVGFLFGLRGAFTGMELLFRPPRKP
jgi:hypothetical protein